MTGSGGQCGQCGATASLRCGGCSVVHYCSRDHQRHHWPTHKQACFPVTQAQQPNAGRCLVAARDVKASQLIMREAPLVLGPPNESFPMCLGCQAPITTEEHPTCPRCHWPLCSPTCADAALHQAECAVLASDTKRVGPPTTYMKTPRYGVILLIRCLLLRDRDPSGWQKVLAMESHWQRRKEDEEPHHDVAVKYVTQYVDLQCDADTAHHVNGAITTNAINSYGSMGEGRRGIYTTLCLMNHSCRPNVTLRSDVDSTIYVHATVDIKKGEPIRFCYLPITDPIWRRHLDLTNIYYFECKCERCTDHTELGTYFSSPKCPKCSEGFLEPYEGPTAPWSCPECGEKRCADDISKEAEEYVKSFEGQCTTVMGATKMLSRVANAYHMTHFTWLIAAQTALRELKETSAECLALRRDLWRRILHLYQKLEPGTSRRIGVTLLNAALVEKDMAMVHLSQATRNKPSQAFEDGMANAVRMLGNAITILELEPPGSTQLHWLQQAREEHQAIYEIIGGKNPNEENP